MVDFWFHYHPPQSRSVAAWVQVQDGDIFHEPYACSGGYPPAEMSFYSIYNNTHIFHYGKQNVLGSTAACPCPQTTVLRNLWLSNTLSLSAFARQPFTWCSVTLVLVRLFVVLQGWSPTITFSLAFSEQIFPSTSWKVGKFQCYLTWQALLNSH